MNALNHARVACLLGVVCLVSFTTADARTIYVNSSGMGDVATIRDAVSAAVDGDTIVLATGTYKGLDAADLLLVGKALTIRSSDPNDPAVVAKTIIDCWVRDEAGHRFFDVGPDAELTLSGLTIVNSAGSHSGGVVLSEDSVLTVVNCTFANNAVLQWGAVFRCENSHATFQNCTFLHNHVSSPLHAGAVYGRQSTLVIEDCRFIENSCKGVVAIDSRATITDCAFENNTGREGGAIFSHVPLGAETGDHLIVRRCTFVGNSATRSGGAIHSYAASPTISSSIFAGNTALVDGGAVYNHRCDTPSIMNCLFSDNWTAGRGGAVTDFYRSRSEIVHCTLVGNTAAKGGAVASIRQSHPLISQSILWQNEADQGSSLYVVQDLMDGASSYATIEYSNVQYGRFGVSVAPGSTLNWDVGNIDADPLFVDPANNDFHLSRNSPCIDAGDPHYVPPAEAKDLDGLPRLHGEAVDMGAYEFQGLGLVKTVHAGAMLGDDGTTQYVRIGTEVTYQICIDNYSDTQHIGGLSVVDMLPDEVEFVTATDRDGVLGWYDRDRHVYTWSSPSLLPESRLCVQLVVRIREDTASGTVITNDVTVDGKDILTQRASVSAVAADAKPKPLRLTKTITDGIQGRDERGIAHVAQGQEMTYTVCVQNDSDRAANNVVVTDSLPAEVTFVSADGATGSYDRDRHVYTWSYPSLRPNSIACVELVVRVRESTALGTTITNHVTIDGEDVITQRASVSATVAEAKPKPLELTKTITGGIQGRDERGVAYVAQGQQITYTICVQNDNRQAANNVVVTDRLPDEVTFISADGVDGAYDFDTHAYTWTYPTLAAGATHCVTLTVKLAHDVKPGQSVVNTVYLNADQAPTVIDSIQVRVVETPMEVALTLSPLIIGRTGHNRSDQVTALLEFPPHIRESDVALETICLDPGGAPAISATRSVISGIVQVRAAFDLAQVLRAIPDNGRKTLYVSGRLRSQRPFIGEGDVLVVARRAF